MRVTVDAALRRGTEALAAAGIEEARAEARILLAHILGVTREQLLLDRGAPLDDAALPRFEALIARRAAHEPVAYLTGTREFWSLDFEVTRDTLIPRPESETLIEALLERLADRAAPLRVLDLGTGTGCLVLALLSELPNALGVGVDLSEAALAVAGRNARRLGLARRVSFLRTSWGQGLSGRFDLIAVNPPYVATGAVVPPDVARYEPASALYAGPSGLDAYAAFASDLARLLAPEGVAALELGAGQADSVAGLLSRTGLVPLERRRDLAGHERCLVVVLAESRRF